jgi:hypothetical protein
MLIAVPQDMLAQKLDRKIDFGATGFSLRNGEGIEVAEVYPGHIADQMGLRPKDVITKFGGIEVPHMGALLYWIDQKKMGDEIILIVKRQGKTEILRGNLQPKPYEQGEGISYHEFSWQGGTNRTIINRPALPGKVPAVLYIQDYHCGSMDFAGRDYEVIPRMAAQFAASGIAFVRIEKPGVGDSRTKLNCLEVGFKSEGKMWEEAMKYVRELDFVDREKIGILAHGFGGNQVIHAVKGGMPCGILFWGYYAAFDNEYCRPLRGEKYWKEAEAGNKLNNWKHVDSRVLFYHGEFDVEDHGGQEAMELNDYFNIQKVNSDYQVYPQADHQFLQVTSDINPEQFRDGIPNPDFFRDHYHATLVDQLVDWMTACWR